MFFLSSDTLGYTEMMSVHYCHTFLFLSFFKKLFGLTL